MDGHRRKADASCRRNGARRRAGDVKKQTGLTHFWGFLLDRTEQVFSMIMSVAWAATAYLVALGVAKGRETCARVSTAWRLLLSLVCSRSQRLIELRPRRSLLFTPATAAA